MNSNTSELKDFEVLFFDVYGTLCDWESGIYEGLKPLLSKFTASSKWSRKEALEAFTAIETDLQAQFPELLYRDLLAKAHEVLEERLKAVSGSEVETTTVQGGPVPTSGSTSTDSGPDASDRHVAFGNSIKDWPLFPDTVEALRSLAERYKLCVLSNVDRPSFARTLAKLSGDEAHPEIYQPPDASSSKYWFPQDTPGSKSPFTLILTAQDVGTYKPALNGFEVALGIAQQDKHLAGEEGKDVKKRVLWVAQSLYHDVEPATRINVRSVWINRAGAFMGLNAPHTYGWKFNTLGEFAEEVSKSAL